MAVPEVDRPTVEDLAAEFIDRQRDGDPPSLEEYVERYPELADEIRELFPTIIKLEGLKHHFSGSSSGYASVGLPGLKRLGDFRIVRELGRGGMGVVYEAEQESLRRRVALKVLGANIASSPKLLSRFRHEAEAAARLHHTNIVPIFGVGEEHGVFFYAMQYIDGAPLNAVIQSLRNSTEPQTLTDVVARCLPSLPNADAQPSHSETVADSTTSDAEQHPLRARIETVDSSGPPRVVVKPSSQPEVPERESGGPGAVVDPREAARMAADLADALEFAHLHGVLHRDVKPSNILVDREAAVWITDFGLAKYDESEDLTRSGDVIGTLRYMAPEQLHGQADVRSDVYSLGLTLYEMLAGRPAFDDNLKAALIQRKTEQAPPPLRSLNSAIPRDLETIVQKACAPLAADRYQTALDFADDLHRFLDERPIRARRMPMLSRTWRWMRRNPVVAALSVLAAVLVIAVGAAVGIGNYRTNLALDDALEQHRLARQNLRHAVAALKEITRDISSRGVPQSLEVTLEGEESIIQTTPVTAADAELLKKLLVFFDEFSASNETDLTAETANIHLEIGGIHHRLGQFQEAEDSYQEAIRTYEALAAGNPGDPEVTIAIADTHNRIGTVQADRARSWSAMQSHNTARKTLEASPDALETDAGQYSLARTFILYHQVGGRTGVADLFDRPGPPRQRGDGDRDDDDRRSADGRQDGDDRAEDDTDDSQRRDRSSRDDREDRRPEDRSADESTRSERGRRRDGDPDDSERSRRRSEWEQQWAEIRQEFSRESIQRAISILEDLVERNPGRKSYQLSLAEAYRVEMVSARHQRGIDDEAKEEQVVQAAENALQLLEELTITYPDDPQYRYELADTYCISVRIQRDLSIDEETRRVEQAAALCDELIRAYPQVSSYQALSAVAARRMAEIQRRKDLIEDAVESYRTAADTYRELTQRFPTASIYPIAQAQTLSELADTVREAGDYDLAFAYAVEAVVVAENCRHLRGHDRFFQIFLRRLKEQRDRLSRRSDDLRSPHADSAL